MKECSRHLRVNCYHICMLSNHSYVKVAVNTQFFTEQFQVFSMSFLTHTLGLLWMRQMCFIAVCCSSVISRSINVQWCQINFNCNSPKLTFSRWMYRFKILNCFHLWARFLNTVFLQKQAKIEVIFKERYSDHFSLIIRWY